MTPASESEAERAIKLLQAVICGVEHGNQRCEDLAVQAAVEIGFIRDADRNDARKHMEVAS